MSQENTNRFNELFLNEWHPYLWITILGFIIYYKSIYFDFSFFDDKILIIDNQPFLRSIVNFFQAFRHDVFYPSQNPIAFYRPLLTISFMINAQLNGIAPEGYHFINILIHITASCLFFVLLVKLGYRAGLSLCTALLFVAHPILSQAVAWIPGRNDSLMAVFLLSSFIMFLNFMRTKKSGYYISHMLFFLLALFTKEISLALPLLCILYLYISGEGKSFLPVKKIMLFGWIFLTIIWLCLREAALKNMGIATLPDIVHYFTFAAPAIVQYIGKIFLPVNLSVTACLKDTLLYYGYISIGLLILVMLYSRNARRSFLVFGLLWFFAFLTPSLIQPQLSWIISDCPEHRIYVPLMGFAIIILELYKANESRFKRKMVIIASIFLVIVMSCITLSYIDNFKNKVRFWENAVLTSPDLPLAHRILATIYYLLGENDKAEQQCRITMSLDPNLLLTHDILGLIHTKRNELSEAEIEYKKEIAVNPTSDMTYTHLGNLYYSQGRLLLAENSWKKSFELNPNNISIIRILALYYHERKNNKLELYYINKLRQKGILIKPQE